jgi:hypothetical protein
MEPLDVLDLMASERPQWSRFRLVEWMFQVVGSPHGGPEPLRLRRGFCFALDMLEVEFPACSSLGVIIAATYDWEILRLRAALHRHRVGRRRTALPAYDVFVALDEGDNAGIEIPAAIAAASVLHSYLAGVGPNRRLLRRIQEQLGVDSDKTVGRHMRPRRWTKCAQARTLATVVGQLRYACRRNGQAAARLGLANATEREEAARLTVQVLSSLR